MWRGRLKEEDVIATVHSHDIILAGERPEVEFLIQMISKKYEIKMRRVEEYLTVSMSGTVTASRLRHTKRYAGKILKDPELEHTLRLQGEMKARRRTDADEDRPSANGMTRPRMPDDDAIDSQALTGGSLHRCGYVVRGQNHRCGTWHASKELAGTSSASQERSVGCAGNRVETWRRSRMLTGEATEPLDGRSQLESS